MIFTVIYGGMMRYLLSCALLFGSVAQANPVGFYRALRHLGFDNKRIGKIVTGVIDHAKKKSDFVLTTEKTSEVTQGYRFFQEESGALVMQKIDTQPGKIVLGQPEIIDINLADYGLALDQLAGLTGREAREAIRLLRRGKPLDLVISKENSDLAGVIFEINDGKLTSQEYFVVNDIKELAEQKIIDFPALRQQQDKAQQQLAEQQTNLFQQLSALYNKIVDHNNNRKVAEVGEDFKRHIAPTPLANKPSVVNERFFVDEFPYFAEKVPDSLAEEIAELFGQKNIEKLILSLNSRVANSKYQLPFLPNKDELAQLAAISKGENLEAFIDTTRETALARQQQLLSSLATEKTTPNKVRLLSDLLYVRTEDISKAISHPQKSSSSHSYRSGTIPLDEFDNRGINRRQKIKELYHQKVEASYLDSDQAIRIHDLIDKIYHTTKSADTRLHFDIDAPQEFFNGRSFSEISADRKQGKVYLTDDELADYQSYLYDEIAEEALKTGQEKEAITLIKRHTDALGVEVCTTADCSVSLIEDYIDILKKELIERANKQYLDEFKLPKKETVVEEVKETVAKGVDEIINLVAKNKENYREVAEGVVVTKNFARKFADLPEIQQNPIVETIESTSDGVQQWREVPQQENILSYLGNNKKNYAHVKKPRVKEARDTGLYTLRIERKTILYFKWEKDGTIVLANFANNDSKNHGKAISSAADSLKRHWPTVKK